MVIKIWCDSENQILLCNKFEVFPAKDCQIFPLTNIGVSCRIIKYGVGERGSSDARGSYVLSF